MGSARLAPVITIAALVLIALAVPGLAAGAPPSLSKRQGVRDVRQAITQEFSVKAKVTRCRRASRLRRSCRARWTDGLRRFTGTVTIRRTGLATSPIDFYRIRGRGTARYLQPRGVRVSGRLVVDTRRARLGQTLRLLGNEGTDLEFTPGQYVDNFDGGEFSPPPAGTRYVGVPVRVVNRASKRLEDSLSNGADLVLSDGRTLSAQLVTTCNDSVAAARGEARVSCVAFSVPFGATIRQFEYQPDSGFGRETGVWR